MDHQAREASPTGRSRRPRRALRGAGAAGLIAVDTNILVYAQREEFEQHEGALAELTRLAEGEAAWALPVFVIGEYLRVVTHPAYLDPPTDRATAVGNIEALVASPSCRVLLPGSRFWSLLKTSVEEAKASGNLVFDAQIVAVCAEHGTNEVLTEDADFRRFTGVRVRRLSPPSSSPS